MQIGTTESRPGQLTEGWFDATELPTGTTERLPVLVAEGTDDGPTLWITGSIHGDEVTGLAAAQDVMAQTLVEHLAGTVVCLPNLNPAGLRRTARTSYYHNDDPNRYFPDPTQEHTRPPRVQERINQHLFERIEDTADALVSLHTAGVDSMPFSILERVRYGEHRSESEAKELAATVQRLADAFGLPTVFEFEVDDHEEQGLHRSLGCSALNVAGIPTFTPELGSHTVVQEQNRAIAVKGLQSVMSELDMLDGDTNVYPKPNPPALDPPVEYDVKRAKHPYTDTAGIARHLIDAGDVIEEGDPVAEIVTPHGNRKTTIHTEHDGYVLGRCSGVAVYENDPLLSMAVRNTGDTIVER
jgi:predicted deacylase